MDEMRMIADLLEETPSERTVAQGRARLGQEIHDPRPVRPQRRRWSLFAGFGLAATAATVTGVVVLGSGTTPRAPDAPPEAAPMTARTVLLAAADKAEKAPASGKYWRVGVLSTLPTQVGPAKNRYWVNKLMVVENWTDRESRTFTGHREAGARPSTVADAAAWRRDGSPARWDMGIGDTADQARIYLYANPRPGQLIKPTGPEEIGVCDKRMTVEQVQALPTEPAALRTKLVKAMENNDDGPVPADARASFVRGCLASLLADVPATPRTRGAAYRALANDPGVRVTGPAKDERGRSGIGLALAESNTRLIIDPRTSLILSERNEDRRNPKSKHISRVYLTVGWTDVKPRVPELP